MNGSNGRSISRFGRRRCFGITLLVVGLLSWGCGPAADTVSVSNPDAIGGTIDLASASAESASVVADDWHDHATAVAAKSRESVVAISWSPPATPDGFVETGFFVAPDLIITGESVGRAGRSHALTVHTFAGTRHPAVVVTTRSDGHGGVALLRLDAAVDVPVLNFGREDDLRPGEPLIAISHPQIAQAEGGWLVTVGPYVMARDGVVYGDIVVDARSDPHDPMLGGAAGAPLIDGSGKVVGVACCKHEWGPSAGIDGLRPAPFLLREAIVHDDRAWHGGLAASRVQALLASDLPG